MKFSRFILAAMMAALAIKANSAVVRFDAPASGPSVGAQFELTAHISNVQDLYAFQFDISFSAQLLRLDYVEESNGFSTGGGFFPGFVDQGNGTAHFISNTLLGPIPGKAGDFPIISFGFTALRSGTAEVQFDDFVLLSSSLEEFAPSALVSTEVEISGGSAVPEPSTGLLIALAGAGLAAIGRRTTHR